MGGRTDRHDEAEPVDTTGSATRRTLIRVLSVCLGLFVLYTAAFGQFESLIQRPIFTAFVVAAVLAMYPLGAGTRWRPLGLAVDLALGAVAVVACLRVVLDYDRIMTDLPEAETLDLLLIAGLVTAILEASRRAVGIIFPGIVALGLAYALFGNLLGGRLGHRGFDLAFIAETLYLGDLGVWGMLTGVAATTIAAFVLFGSMLLFTGTGQTFIDLAVRLSGRSPGGAAKIATIASGLFGTISGSAVANVATTGNFTIPLMRRLGYPSAFAGAVEAVASTGGQLAPPVMGAAAFVLAEIVGVPYVDVAVAAILPAALFYLAVFLTVHVAAIRMRLPIVPAADIPAWRTILTSRRMLPILGAFGGLLLGVFTGRSVQTSAFWGILGLILAHAAFALRSAKDFKAIALMLRDALDDAGRGLVLIGILLVGAQILVSMVNMTGFGITLSSWVAGAAGQSAFLLAGIVAAICLVLGMGIPTTAAYVLVAAVLAPAMIQTGIPALTAHLFVFYFATLSVITPPVCVAVFVAAGIAQARWMDVAFEACKLAAATYVIPFLFLIYPGMLAKGGMVPILDAIASGCIFVVAFAALFGGARLFRSRLADAAFYLAIVVAAITPHWSGLVVGGVLTATAWWRIRKASIAGGADYRPAQ